VVPGFSLRTFAKWAGIFAVVGVIYFALNWLIGLWWTFGIFIALVVLLLIALLLMQRTAWGARVGQRIALMILRTRWGPRFQRSQIRSAAKRAGVSLVDATGREKSLVELQLEMDDSPATQQIRRQLAAMNPVQRGQAMRMLEAQQEAYRGVDPEDLPKASSGSQQLPRSMQMPTRPVTRPPRPRQSRKKRR
jgi:hypothetical protein